MKYDLKTLILTITLGSFFYFISYNIKNKAIENTTIKNKIESTKPIDKTEKNTKLPAPKVYIFDTKQNYLETGNNINSKR